MITTNIPSSANSVQKCSEKNENPKLTKKEKIFIGSAIIAGSAVVVPLADSFITHRGITKNLNNLRKYLPSDKAADFSKLHEMLKSRLQPRQELNLLKVLNKHIELAKTDFPKFKQLIKEEASPFLKKKESAFHNFFEILNESADEIITISLLA